ncbi:MAG: hypothetical protein L3J32_09400 [Rhizobiaceae bacterium]|nr:hypothetical protein [Rhizobiaceae bacterium]
MKILISASVAALVFSLPHLVYAGNFSSAYTTINFDRDCKVIDEYELGVSAKCKGYTEPGMPAEMEWPVYFSEGDLRQMVRFGRTTEKTDRWESFGQFNSIGRTIEWRLKGSKPVAAVLRWYIERENPATGEYDKKSEGQVLVISTVADSDNPDNACVVGYVDARANKDANILARLVADTIAPTFECDVDKPLFHGVRGDTSGSPTNFSE